MADPEHGDETLGVLNPRDYAIVADPISPKFAEPLTLQRLTDRTRIFEKGDSVAEKAENTSGGLGIELIEFARRGPLELNSLRHGGG